MQYKFCLFLILIITSISNLCAQDKKTQYGILFEYQNSISETALTNNSIFNYFEAARWQAPVIGIFGEYNFSNNFGIGLQSKIAFNESNFKYQRVVDDAKKESYESVELQFPIYLSATLGKEKFDPYVNVGYSFSQRIATGDNPIDFVANSYHALLAQVGLEIVQEKFVIVPYFGFDQSISDLASKEFQRQGAGEFSKAGFHAGVRFKG